ncbi:hypothetical protein [Pseudochrobactrum kiredjianiae]|uniref:Uncharacterized protein n=1 Tax=Pseudochrobactrum kiredjianiae TaxID=386305 RepID=A0ABW3V6J3_9HYPH|nr:hypothetical protein [Pseudochrobactrum kiredjianiae]MDM7853028.1 hypothetical protein [Pseudochrobactrum kiredjianiae]
MENNNTKTINDQDVDYVYGVSIKFDKTGVTTSSSPIKYGTADKIKATIAVVTLVDSVAAANTKVIMQINPPSADVTIFNKDGSVAVNDDDLGEGKFLFTTDGSGQVIVYFASINNGYQNVSAYVQADGKSPAVEYVVFFGDYSHADTSIPSPSVDLNDQSVLEISQTDPYFYVALIQADAIDTTQGNSCVAIVNNKYFKKIPYQDALESTGMSIPSAWLSTQDKNQLANFIENDVSAVVFSSPTLEFLAEGTPYNHPKIDPVNLPRNLTSRPYLNTGQTSITPSNYSNLYVSIDRAVEPGGGYTYNLNDKIKFTMYVNGFFAGSILSNVTVFDLNDFTVKASCPDTVSVQIPAANLEGFGANISNTAGRYDIDYEVIPANETDPKKYGRPVNWLKGNINTVA